MEFWIRPRFDLVPVDHPSVAWRVVLAHPPCPPIADDDGVWRPPGLPDVEVALLDFTPGYDPSTDLVRGALDRAGWERADAFVQWVPEYRALPLDALDEADRVAAVFGDWNVAGRALRL